MCREISQAVDRCDIRRLELDKFFESGSLGLSVAAPRREPGTKRDQSAFGQIGCRYVGRRSQNLIGSIGGLGPLEASVPDIKVIGPGLLAAGEPFAGFLIMAEARRQVGKSQPNSIIIGGRSFRLTERLGDGVDLIRVVIQAPESAQHVGRITRSLGVLLQEPPVFVTPARDPVNSAQQPPSFITLFAPRANRTLETCFGESIPKKLDGHAGASHGDRWRFG